MNKYLSLFFLTVIAYPQTLHITPEFTFGYESDNAQYAAKDLAIQDFDFVLVGKYQSNKFHVLGRMGYHLIDGTLLEPNNFTRKQGFQYLVQDKGLENQKNYWI